MWKEYYLFIYFKYILCNVVEIVTGVAGFWKGTDSPYKNFVQIAARLFVQTFFSNIGIMPDSHFPVIS